MSFSDISNIMVVWGFVATVLVFYCIFVVVRPRSRSGGERVARKALFDFSASQEEARQVHLLLEQALAGAETAADFERNYKRLTGGDTGLEAEYNWAWLNRWLMDYRKVGEFDEATLVLVRRYLADTSRLYGVKDGAVPEAAE